MIPIRATRFRIEVVNTVKFLLLPLLFVSLSLHAQRSDSAAQAVVKPAMPGVWNRSPSKGLLLNYRMQSGFQMQMPDGSSRRVWANERETFKVKVPLYLKPGFAALLGVHYEEERYFIEGINTPDAQPTFADRLDQVDLHTTRLSLYLTKSLGPKFYTALRAEVMFSGDYPDLDDSNRRHRNYRVNGILGYKRSANTEYGVGLYYSDRFRTLPVVPFAYYNHTFNEKWGVELAIPVKLMTRYNFGPGHLLLFGPEYESRRYSIAASDRVYDFRRAAITYSATYQYQIKGWLWAQAKAGYAWQLNTRVDDLTGGETLRLQTRDAPFASVGIFLSPSKINKK